MKLNCDPVNGRNRRCVSTNLHGIASRTKLVIIFVIYFIFRVRFVTQGSEILNKAETANCDGLVTAYFVVYTHFMYGKKYLLPLTDNIYVSIYIYVCIYIYIGIFMDRVAQSV